MKFQTSAIALAVAGALAVPMSAQAEGAGAYASIRGGLLQTDASAPTDSIDYTNRGSRIGFKGETDMGNGMTGYGLYEWNVGAGSGGAGVGSTRHGLLGIKGGFGAVELGQTYHNYYDHVEGVVDIANWNSNWFGAGRTGQAVS
jgi:predicted porin